MDRIHSAASASSPSPTTRHTRPTPVVDEHVDRARVDEGREGQVTERRGADDHRRQPGLADRARASATASSR